LQNLARSTPELLVGWGDFERGRQLLGFLTNGEVQMIRQLGLTVLLVVFGSPLRADDGKDDAKAHQGTWLVEEAEMAGQKFPEEVRKMIKLVIDGDNYTVTIGPQTDKGTVKRDPKANPKTMDITGTEGPNKGKTMLAIYDLKGDTMKICYDLSGTKRPTEFKTEPNTQLFLATYKREKP
jgi:uncharacterized protein (TIGR03067 family)